MGFFLIYVALPCLFYRVLAQTPLEELSNPPLHRRDSARDRDAFALAFGIGWAFRRNMAEATIAGLSGSYGNIGYMGPGLALATLGPPRTCRSRSSSASTRCCCSASCRS